MYDPTVLPPDLPAPVDDGAARHLVGMPLPRIALRSTSDRAVILADLAGRVVVFAYPRSGRPGEPPIDPDWDLIPGARGCTPQACSFRDLAQELSPFASGVFGLSTQSTEYQQEFATRLHLPFEVLSDDSLDLANAIALPTMRIAEQMLLKRLAWVQNNGVIEHVFYPVFPPDQSASQVLAWLRTAPSA
jgi:peroxiredoxin